MSPKAKEPEIPRVQKKALHERTILEILPHEEILNVIDDVGSRNLVDTGGDVRKNRSFVVRVLSADSFEFRPEVFLSRLVIVRPVSKRYDEAGDLDSVLELLSEQVGFVEEEHQRYVFQEFVCAQLFPDD